MSQALSLHADEIYESLATIASAQLCRGIFQALTVEESNSRGIRRPQRLGRLCEILDVPADELLPIIDAYRQSGVTFLMPGPEVELTDRTIIDISHESLMRVWPRLRQWVEEETQAAGIFRRLSESAALYQQGKAGLYRDPELGIALAWRESKQPNAAWAEQYRAGFETAIGFLEASQQASVAEEQAREAARQRELEQARQLAEAQQLRLEQQQRAARKLRMMIAGLAAVALIAGLACVAALFANQRAITLADTARAKRGSEARPTRTRRTSNLSRRRQAPSPSSHPRRRRLREACPRPRRPSGWLEPPRRRAASCCTRPICDWPRSSGATIGTTAEQLRVLLAKHIPEQEGRTRRNRTSCMPPHLMKSDLRGFEWYYYQHLLEEQRRGFLGARCLRRRRCFHREWSTGDARSERPGEALGPGFAGTKTKRAAATCPAAPALSSASCRPTAGWPRWPKGTRFTYLTPPRAKRRSRSIPPIRPYRRLIFSRDGDRLVIVDDKIRWCNAASGEVIASVDQKFDRVESLALSADGLTLAVVGHGYDRQLFSIFRLDATAKTVTPLAKDVGLGGTLSASALSPDGQRIAVGA